MLSSITDDYVVLARRLAAKGEEPEEVARRCNLDPKSLAAAVRGLTFQHITDPAPVPEVLVASAAQGDVHAGHTGGTRLRLDGMRLRAARVELGMSQSVFAMAVQDVCQEMGVRTSCTKRLVQKWENGDHGMPLPVYQQAIAKVTGEKIESLCEPLPPIDASEAARLVTEIISEQQDSHRRISHKLMELHAMLNVPTG
jgi:transcriptional regulator with XRE-family HTH domain